MVTETTIPATKREATATKLADDRETSSHIKVQPLHKTPAHLEGWDYDRDLQPSRTISLHPRRAGHNVSRPSLDHAAVRRHGRRRRVQPPRNKHLLSQGTTGLSVAFDLPTQIGMGSDSPLAMGEVGKVGVAIDSIEDMMRLFEGINLEQISTSMTINATASILLARST